MATQLTIDERIDEDLRFLYEEWLSVDATVAEWPRMDGIDREVFILEWSGINDGKLAELKSLTDQMTPAQKRRYDELLALAAEKRPALEKLQQFSI